MRVKSTEFVPNRPKERNGVQGTLVFSAPTNAMEVPLGKLQKNNAIAHCGKLYKENLRLDPVSGEVWIVAGWLGGGDGCPPCLGSGWWRGGRMGDGCSNNQRPGALASLEAG